MEWNGDKVIESIRAKAGRNVARACYHLHGRVREMISIPSRTVTRAPDKNGKLKTVLGPRGSNRSKPGEPPHKDYGNLRQSIAVDVNQAEMRGLVGTNLKYGRFLELGTSRMAARPFLRRALAEERQRIVEIVEGRSNGTPGDTAPVT